MDAVEFLVEAERAWRTNPTRFKQMLDLDGMKYDAAYIVAQLQNFVKEHPRKTNQSEFLKHYPNAKLKDGVLTICPDEVFGDEEIPFCTSNCHSCQKEFWLHEI